MPVVAPSAGASSVAPFPSILSDDSSESEGNAADVGSTSVSASEEIASGRHGLSTKALHLEESEAESKEQAPSARLRSGCEGSGCPSWWRRC